LKRGLNENLIDEVILILEKEGNLPAKFRPHKLNGNYKGFFECHIQADWLLIWEQADEIRLISLHRTGTHSDLFK
jgi:mRNA interferase YafQ